MVRLESRGSWSWLLIPAFVYFFQQLYPFRWVADPAHRTAAAAGGCILVRERALRNSGGLEQIRGALIDDCALARKFKVGHGYRLWLGLSTKTHSLRPYHGLRGVWTMVSRNAFTQLGYSPVNLTLAIIGMLVTYLAGPICVIVALFTLEPATFALGGAIWLLMSVSFMPTLRLYGESGPAALFMPIVAMFYMTMTLDSACRYWWGGGNKWKGRVTATRPRLRVPSMTNSLEVKVFYPARWWRRISEAQGRRCEAGSEGSVEQSRDPMDKNRIRGLPGRTSGQRAAKSIAIKGRYGRSGGCAAKAVGLTSGDLRRVRKSRTERVRKDRDRGAEVSRGHSSRLAGEGPNDGQG